MFFPWVPVLATALPAVGSGLILTVNLTEPQSSHLSSGDERSQKPISHRAVGENQSNDVSEALL